MFYIRTKSAFISVLSCEWLSYRWCTFRWCNFGVRVCLRLSFQEATSFSSLPRRHHHIIILSSSSNSSSISTFSSDHQLKRVFGLINHWTIFHIVIVVSSSSFYILTFGVKRTVSCRQISHHFTVDPALCLMKKKNNIYIYIGNTTSHLHRFNVMTRNDVDTMLFARCLQSTIGRWKVVSLLQPLAGSTLVIENFVNYHAKKKKKTLYANLTLLFTERW